ncbi:RNA polymerase sigma-70 factor [Heyndrickxia oleronia]|uniref:RNA polymerase sigma factor SigJ n=1 Tax=Heyndrickxia oleronia TaxID=38875 RepID=A0A8E2I4L1_9BACI|nr:RNA polymerase sigma-70 factor [Heyndrickxia oleronia]MEC1374493.1 RNA polymerase sigma-70 factor [Heyndrickxia oleronia]OOP66581.1 RNA polymerase sigma factor SigJ [Heyndrickxia oleronia]QQZ05930.1 RNA polymerase sigma-70 factor [Heyndrickxia oleronia]
METEQLYQTYKPLLFSIAYRMTGSVTDAEDLVQEAFLTYNSISSKKVIENKKAYLCRIVMNSSIDKLRSAASKREVYVGEWLPEPLVDDGNDPSNTYLIKESISTAYLLLLQQLSGDERAFFILREVFQYSYEEIAAIIEKSSTNCRQIFHRAKKGMENRPKAASLDFQSMRSRVEQFTMAFQEGNIHKMLELLKTDSVFISDGGGKVKAAINPIYTSERIVFLFTSIMKKLPKNSKMEFKDVNGYPGVVVSINDYVAYVISIEFLGDKISRIYMVANPDKLAHLQSNK